MEYPNLKKVLADRSLLADENKMWLRVGMYVTTEPFESNALHQRCVRLYDGMGSVTHVPETIGSNLRTSIINWWQSEKEKPRSKEVTNDPTGLDALEARNVS